MGNLQTISADPQPDWAQILPREAFREVIRVLRGSMPFSDEDTPEDRGRRERAAMATVASLRPENAAEGEMAAHFVMAEAWAADCLRLARERRREIGLAMKCKAQALSCMREAKGAWRMLLKTQAERRALEKDTEARSRAEWAEHAALGMMAEGLGPVAAAAGDGVVVPVAAVGTVAPHLGPAHEGEGEGKGVVGGGDFAVGSVPEFGHRLNSGTESRGVRCETKARLGTLSGGLHAFASV